jgi:hypothetical protein
MVYLCFFIQHWTCQLKFFTYSLHSFILHRWCIFCTNLLLIFLVMYTLKLYFIWTLYLQQNSYHTLMLARSLTGWLACSHCPLLYMTHNMWLSVYITLLHFRVLREAVKDTLHKFIFIFLEIVGSVYICYISCFIYINTAGLFSKYSLTWREKNHRISG